MAKKRTIMNTIPRIILMAMEIFLRFQSTIRLTKMMTVQKVGLVNKSLTLLLDDASSATNTSSTNLISTLRREDLPVSSKEVNINIVSSRSNIKAAWNAKTKQGGSVSLNFCLQRLKYSFGTCIL